MQNDYGCVEKAIVNIKWLAIAAVSSFSAIAFAGNDANPDAIELAPLPMPAEFKSDMDRPVAFDASTTVVVECPDAKGAEWIVKCFNAIMSCKVEDRIFCAQCGKAVKTAKIDEGGV